MLRPRRGRAGGANWPTAARKLLAVRERRVRPGRDDKVLVSWNGLMIDALAQAAGALDEPRYLAAATRGGRFHPAAACAAPTAGCCTPGATGQAKLDAYLDDYACLANALVTLYEADFDERWIDEAVRLADIVLAQFADRERRRILLHGRRPRSADRPAEGRVRQLRAQRQRRWRPRRWCAWGN